MSKLHPFNSPDTARAWFHAEQDRVERERVYKERVLQAEPKLLGHAHDGVSRPAGQLPAVILSGRNSELVNLEVWGRPEIQDDVLAVTVRLPDSVDPRNLQVSVVMPEDTDQTGLTAETKVMGRRMTVLVPLEELPLNLRLKDEIGIPEIPFRLIFGRLD